MLRFMGSQSRTRLSDCTELSLIVLLLSAFFVFCCCYCSVVFAIWFEFYLFSYFFFPLFFVLLQYLQCLGSQAKSWSQYPGSEYQVQDLDLQRIAHHHPPPQGIFVHGIRWNHLDLVTPKCLWAPVLEAHANQPRIQEHCDTAPAIRQAA